LNDVNVGGALFSVAANNRLAFDELSDEALTVLLVVFTDDTGTVVHTGVPMVEPVLSLDTFKFDGEDTWPNMAGS
jgi:hypothetical protein